MLASSQGDSAFAVCRIDAAAPAYIGRLRAGAAGPVDAPTGTDGLDVFPARSATTADGLIVVQDLVSGGTQNFKLVDWRVVKQALGVSP